MCTNVDTKFSRKFQLWKLWTYVWWTNAANAILLDSYSFSARSQNCEKPHAIFYVKKHFPEYRAIYEIVWKNIVGPDRPQMKI